jgi:hypothetical protein
LSVFVQPPEPLPPEPVEPPVPVVLIVVQVPLVQVWPPVQAWPQLPQLLVLEFVSMQLPLHNCWPETVQLHVPLTQDAPVPQALPQVPQLAAFVGPLQVPSEHFVPDEQVDEQVPVLSQTSPPEHTAQLVPQCWGLDWTQVPPQLTKPPVQTQEPEVQVLPVAQTFPQLPQFWLSVCRLAQVVPHCIWPELQEGPVPPVPVPPLVPPVPSLVEGFAHPEASKAAPKSARQDKKALARENILNSLWGAERTKRRPRPGRGALYPRRPHTGKGKSGPRAGGVRYGLGIV